jgi:hypothetical protein
LRRFSLICGYPFPTVNVSLIPEAMQVELYSRS